MPPVPRYLARKIAEETLETIEHGSYTLPLPDSSSNASHVHNLTAKLASMKSETVFYPADSPILSPWAASAAQYATPSTTEISIVETSTIEGTRSLVKELGGARRVGALNFASAKNVSIYHITTYAFLTTDYLTAIYSLEADSWAAHALKRSP